MKNFKLRKLLTVMAITLIAAAAISPIKASAAWRQADNGNWSYTEQDKSISGWKSIDGKWYYFDSNAIMKTGWILDGSTWYYLVPSGEMKTGWVNDGGKWYFTSSSGAMQTGWVSNNGVWYYLSTSGDMKTGLIEVNNKSYYLDQSGAMKTGNVAINGVNYSFAASGEKITSSAPNTTNETANKLADTTTATATNASGGSGGSGGSSGGSSSSTKTSSYKDLYGTWEVGNCISKNGKLTDEQIALCEGTQLTLKDSTIYYGSIAVPATSINEGTINSSDFTNKYNVAVSGDKVTAVSTNISYDQLKADVTVYTAKNKSNEEVHYALLKGNLFELEKK